MTDTSDGITPIQSQIDGNKPKQTRKSRTTPHTRDEIKRTLTRVINQFREKATNGRIRDPDIEKARRESARIVIYACSVYLTALKDQELEKIEERLLVLEKGGI